MGFCYQDLGLTVLDLLFPVFTPLDSGCGLLCTKVVALLVSGKGLGLFLSQGVWVLE